MCACAAGPGGEVFGSSFQSYSSDADPWKPSPFTSLASSGKNTNVELQGKSRNQRGKPMQPYSASFDSLSDGHKGSSAGAIGYVQAWLASNNKLVNYLSFSRSKFASFNSAYTIKI